MATTKADRRRKLTDEQRREIIAKFNRGGPDGSKRALANEYHVRRYTIATTVNPELRKISYQREKYRKSLNSEI